MSYFYLNPESFNVKTGPIPVSTSSKDTCPPFCPFKGQGCYGETGPMRHHWDLVNEGKRGGNLDEFCQQIAQLPAHQLWRHNQAGDLPGQDGTIDTLALCAIIRANYRRRGYTYTHKYRTRENRFQIRYANKCGFTVNLSANNPEQADELVGYKVGPVFLVLASWETRKKFVTAGGNTVKMCPAVYTDTTCQKCKWCAQPRRKFIVGVPAHGVGYSKVNQACGYTPMLWEGQHADERIEYNSHGRG